MEVDPSFRPFQCGASLAGGFVGAYLLRSGFSLAAALAAYALYLTTRATLRFAALGLVRRIGPRDGLVLGTVLIALQFLPLLHADCPAGLIAWVLCISAGEALYWPLYHAATAVCGDTATRGRQVGLRTTIATLLGVVLPLAGACLLTRFGAAAMFGLAAAATVLSSAPLLLLRTLPVGPMPTIRDAWAAVDKLAMLTVAADGWLSAGLVIAWPMVLFTSLGSDFAMLGAVNTAAGLTGAAASYFCGRGIDRGHRHALLNLVSILLTLSFIMRAASGWSPFAAAGANLLGAVVNALYGPVVMSLIYERAKRSGACFRFHFATEGAWDIGAISGCLLAALLAWMVNDVPVASVLPAMVGINLIYRCVRAGDPPAAPQRLPLHAEALAA